MLHPVAVWEEHKVRKVLRITTEAGVVTDKSKKETNERARCNRPEGCSHDEIVRWLEESGEGLVTKVVVQRYPCKPRGHKDYQTSD